MSMRGVYVCISCMLLVEQFGQMVNGQITPLAWVNEPKYVTVLTGRNATFNWQHNSATYVDITWYHLGTKIQPRRETIMLFTKNHVTTYGALQNRLFYKYGKGSAAMILTGVTPGDEGYYEAKVIRGVSDATGAEYISCRTYLAVLSTSDATVILSIDNSIYSLSLDQNGTVDTTLPALTSTFPASYQLTVNVSSSVHLPVIVIRHVMNNTTQRTTCQQHVCARLIVFNTTLPVSTDTNTIEGQILVSIDFNIQGVSPLLVATNVTLTAVAEPVKHLSSEMMLKLAVAVLSVIILVLMAMLVVMVILTHRRANRVRISGTSDHNHKDYNIEQLLQENLHDKLATDIEKILKLNNTNVIDQLSVLIKEEIRSGTSKTNRDKRSHSPSTTMVYM